MQCEPQVNRLTPSSGRTRTGEVLMLRLTQGVQKRRPHVNNPAKVADINPIPIQLRNKWLTYRLLFAK